LNNKIVFTKRISAIFLATVLVTGTIVLSILTFMSSTAQAESYYNGVAGMDDNYNNQYGKDNKDYDNSYYKSKDSSSSNSVTLKKIKCNNINLNVNGLELTALPPAISSLLTDGEAKDEGQYGSSSYYGSYGGDGDGEQQSGYDNNNNSFKFVCINNNNNTIVEGEEPELPISPEPPIPPIEPTTAILTVNKEIFGCTNISSTPSLVVMECGTLQAGDPRWISCDDPLISNTIFCQFLTEDLFDIEVLDDQGNQIAQFEGSLEGETIENLEPGTYTVNEMHTETGEAECNTLGFEDGFFVIFNGGTINYQFCIEYEDEQGNDCSTITLTAGEEKTCTVKNHIVRSISQ
jgi:hypothetical protein